LHEEPGLSLRHPFVKKSEDICHKQLQQAAGHKGRSSQTATTPAAIFPALLIFLILDNRN
jgi:hypothetical protein